MSDLAWSLEQQLIFLWFEKRQEDLDANCDRLGLERINVHGHLVIRARAGCGKSTTAAEGVRRAPESRKWVGAFGNKNKEDLEPRFVGRQDVKVQTFHGLGCGYVMSRWNGVNVCKNNERAKWLTEQIVPAMVPDDVKDLVTKLHTHAREIVPHATNGAELLPLAIQFECQPEEDWVREGYDTMTICCFAAQVLDFASRTRPEPHGIDYSDMIFLPVRNGWMRPRFDLLIADEAQDLTSAQLELAIGSVTPRGRICIIGDDRQAIYSWRGADVNSLDRLKGELRAGELGLKTTYRCCTAVADRAAEIVPDFTAGPMNPRGTVRSIMFDRLLKEVAYGDFIISRANAPLMPTAIGILRSGRQAVVVGRNIGDGLKALVNKLAKGPARSSVAGFIARLGAWRDKELVRAKVIASQSTRKAKIEYITDQHDMLLELCDGAVSVNAVIALITDLFTDKGLGSKGVVTLSSVHRAKGLEADRVFILADTLRNGSVEEDNIRYVAITRAKHELTFVFKGDR